jgi:hypothetical protein
MPRITLALIGDSAAPFTRISDEEWSRRWDERPQIEMDVADEESLEQIIARALPEFGVALPEGWGTAHGHVDIALYDDANARGYSRVHGELTLVNEDGGAVWGVHDFRLVPYGHLVDAVRAGALAGDKRRIHLILREPIGNGIGLDWPDLLHAWEAASNVIARISDVGGVVAFAVLVIQAVRRRLGRGVAVATRAAPRWAQRGAHFPWSLASFLGQRPWSSDQLAELLRSTPEDAEAVLAIFGFAPKDDGLWHYEGDEAARVLAIIFEEVRHLYPALSGDDYFEQRVEELITTGQLSERADPAEDLEFPIPGDDEGYCAFCAQIRSVSELVSTADGISICRFCAVSVVAAFLQIGPDDAQSPPSEASA